MGKTNIPLFRERSNLHMKCRPYFTAYNLDKIPDLIYIPLDRSYGLRHNKSVSDSLRMSFQRCGFVLELELNYG